MLIGLVAGEGEGGGEEEEERESHSKVGTLLGPTISKYSIQNTSTITPILKLGGDNFRWRPTNQFTGVFQRWMTQNQ